MVNQPTQGTDATSSTMAIGFADSKLNERTISYRELSAQATMSAVRGNSTTKVLSQILSGGTIAYECDLKSMDADGFTLTWTTNNASANQVHYMAFGGSELDTSIGQFNAPTTTGNHAVTGVGFTPDLIFFLPTQATAAYHGDGSCLSFGVCNDNLENCAFSIGSTGSPASTSVCGRTSDGVKCIQAIDPLDPTNGTAAQLHAASISSMDADGFTLNWSHAPTTASKPVFFLAVKNILSKVGAFNKRTSAGNQALTGFGFSPKGGLFFSGGDTTSLGVWTSEQMTLCASSGSTAANNCGVGVTSISGLGTSDTTMVAWNTLMPMIVDKDFSPTTTAKATINSLDADGLTVNWSLTGVSALEILYAAFGPIPSVAYNASFTETVAVGAGSQSRSAGRPRTISNVIVASEGVVDYSLKFDGVDDYVDCGNDATLWSQALTKFSFSLWIRPTANPNISDKFIVQHGWFIANQAFLLYNYFTGQSFNFGIKDSAGNNAIANTAPNTYVKDKWYHITCTYDSTLGSANVKIYMDGVVGPTTANSTATINQSTPLQISTNSQDFEGYIKDFRWWTNKALTQAEIDAVRANLSTAPTPNYWLKMNEGSGNPVDNISGTKVGTLTNGTSWIQIKPPAWESWTRVAGKKRTLGLETYDNYPATYSITTDAGSGSAPCNVLSPNSKWRCIYRGINPSNGADTGQVGVRAPSVTPPTNDPRVFYAYPYANTNAINDTDATLTLSEKSYGDIDVTFYMRTKAQRKTTFVKEWETAWFMWHFNPAGNPITDPDAHFHHYYVLLKTTGKIELGRKDTVSGVDFQYFIDSSTGSYGNEPTFTWVLGQWYKCRIQHIGNHIKFWLDDVLKVDAIDDGTWGTPNTDTHDGSPPHPPSSYMYYGQFGFYAEDAEAEWTPLVLGSGTADNVLVTSAVTRRTAKQRTLPNTVAMSSTVIRLAAKKRTISDTITVGVGTLTRLLGKKRTISNTTTLSDTWDPTQGKKRSFSNTIALGDTLSRKKAASRTLPNTTIVSDSWDPEKDHFRSFSNTTTLGSNLLSRIVGKKRTISNTTTISGNIVRGLSHFARTFSSTITSTDSWDPEKDLFRSFTNTIALGTNLLSRIAGKKRTFSNSIVLADTLARLKANKRTLTNTTTVSDTLSRSSAKQRAISNTTTISGNIVRGLSTFARTFSNTTTVGAGTLTRLKGVKRVFTETTTLSSTMIRSSAKFRTVSDTITISGLISRILGAKRTFSNTIALGDSMARLKGVLRTFTNTTTVGAGTLTRLLGLKRSFTNTITVSGTLARAGFNSFTRTFTNTIVISDSVVRLLTKYRSFSNTTVVSGTVARVLGAKRTFTNTTTLSSTVIRILGVKRSLPNTVTIGETWTRLKIAFRTFTNTTTVTGTLARVFAHPRAFTNTITLSDSMIRRLGLTRPFTETITVGAGTFVRLLNKFRTISDTTTISGTLTRLAPKSRSFTNTVTLSESFVRLLGAKRTFTNTTVISATFTRLKVMFRSFTNTTTVSGTLTRLAPKLRSFTETVTPTDTITRIKGAKRTFSESTSVSGTISRGAGVFVRVITNTVSVSSALSVLKRFQRAISDTITTSDVLDPGQGKGALFEETVDVDDTFTRNSIMDRVRDFTNTVPVTDVLSIAHDNFASFSETISVVSTIVRRVVFQRATADSTTLSDLITRSIGRTRGFTESGLNLGQGVMTRLLELKRILPTDTTAISDAFSMQGGIAVFFSETVNIADAVLTQVDKVRDITDSVSIVDTWSRMIELSREIVEDIFPDDTFVSRKDLGRLFSETIGVSDFLDTLGQRVVLFTETVVVSGAINRIIGRVASFSETISVSDVMENGAEKFASFLENTPITSTIDRLITTMRSFAETIPVTDLLHKVIRGEAEFTEDVFTSDDMERLLEAQRPFKGQLRVYSLNFATSTDHIIIPDNPIFRNLSQFSFSFWMYPRTLAGGQMRMMITHGWPNNQSFAVWLHPTIPDRIMFGIKRADGTQITARHDGVMLNQWQHVMVSYDNQAPSGNLNIMLNGDDGITGNLTETINIVDSFRIGNNTVSFDGDLADVRYWLRPSDAMDCETLMDGGGPWDMDAWWPLNEGTGAPIEIKKNITTNIGSGTSWSLNVPDNLLDIVRSQSTLSVSKAQERMFTETVIPSDSITRSEGFKRVVTDAISIFDSVQILFGTAVFFVENISVTDAINRATGSIRTFTENVSTSDFIARRLTFARSFTEIIGADDIIDRVIGYARTFEEDLISLSDSLLSRSDKTRTIIEDVIVDDVWDKMSTYGREFTEPLVNVFDVFHYGILVSFAEFVNLTDSMERQSDKFREAIETVDVDDIQDRMITLARSFLEHSDIGDVLTPKLDKFRAIIETISTSDSFVRKVGFARIFSEPAVFVSDAISQMRGFFGDFTEDTDVGDVIEVVMSAIRSFAETTGVSDSLNRRIAIVRNFSETVIVSDTMDVINHILRDFFEDYEVADIISTTSGLLRNFSEAITTSDSLDRAKDMFREITETIAEPFFALVREIDFQRELAEELIESSDFWITQSGPTRGFTENTIVQGILTRNAYVTVFMQEVIELIDNWASRKFEPGWKKVATPNTLLLFFLMGNWPDDGSITPRRSEIDWGMGSRYSGLSDYTLNVHQISGPQSFIDLGDNKKHKTARVQIEIFVRDMTMETKSGFPPLMKTMRDYIRQYLRDNRTALFTWGIDLLQQKSVRSSRMPDTKQMADVWATVITLDMIYQTNRGD